MGLETNLAIGQLQQVCQWLCCRCLLFYVARRRRVGQPDTRQLIVGKLRVARTGDRHDDHEDGNRQGSGSLGKYFNRGLVEIVDVWIEEHPDDKAPPFPQRLAGKGNAGEEPF